MLISSDINLFVNSLRRSPWYTPKVQTLRLEKTQHHGGGHLADNLRIVDEAGSAGISIPAIGFGSGAGDEVCHEKGIEAGGQVTGDLVQADAAGAKTGVLDLDDADDQYLALMAAPAAGDRIVLASTVTSPASGFRSRASMLRRSLAQTGPAL